MKTFASCFLTLCALLFAELPALAQGGHSPRSRELFNFGWKFHAGDVPGAASPDTDDSGWRTVDLPHDFQIEQPWVSPDASERPDNSDEGANVRSRLSARGFKEMGVGWYRKTFTPADSLRGRRVLLDFEGIMLVGDVYLNGERVGGTDYGYVGFDIDISQRLNYGAPNVVAVRADTRSADNSRWYTGGGIFRDVHLVATDARMHFTRHPLYIRTEVGADNAATVRLQAETECLLDSKTKSLAYHVRILDTDGREVAARTSEPVFRAKQKTCEYQLDDIVIGAPRLWSCEAPHLYTAEVTLLRPDGSVADRVSQRFGIRTLEFSPGFGMKLNGRKVLLKGIANHHTLGALGAAAYPRAIEKRIQLLKEFGFNHIRTSHNPYSESLLDLCDQYGILVVDELYDKWLDRYVGGRRPWTELWQRDIPEFIKRDRNHPSVVVWSLGNELQTYWELPFADWGVTAYRMQRELVHRYDRSRPITVAMHPRGRSLDTDSLPAPLAVETDIASYNYRYMYFPGDARNYPHMIFYQSEANNQMMGPNFFDMDLDKVLGLAYWGMIDYLGESQGWPAKGWNLGVFDISLEPKPNAYFLRSYFSDSPMVRIGVFQSASSADWNGVRQGTTRLTEALPDASEAGTPLTLHTYTNADEVELLVNGRSVGTQRNNRQDSKARNKMVWRGIAYEPGTVEAVARTDGKVVARHRLETAGRAARLRLTPDNPQWRADGMDLQHVRVHAVDGKGRRVHACNALLRFSVSGDARIAAVGNGDMNSDELNATDTRSLYDGSALVILRSGTKGGKVVLTVEADGLKPASVSLQCTPRD